MEQKTKITAEDGRADLLITRDFDLPLALLFLAHTDPAIVAQWMGTKVLKLEARKHGSWQFETSDANGTIMFRAHGVFHDVVPNSKITRTFEMGYPDFDAQLDFLEFEALGDTRSRLTIHSVYRSPEHRARQLELPFAYGLNMAHNKLEQIAGQLK